MKFTGVIAGLVLALLGLMLIALLVGVYPIPLDQLPQILGYLFDPQSQNSPGSQDLAGLANVLLYIRLPRIVGAVLCGFSLSLAGVLMQGLFKNPLAGPDVLGVSAGASLGAVVSIVMGVSGLIWATPAFAIAGGLLTAFIIYTVAGGGRNAVLLHVVLAGLAISGFLSALVSALLLFANTYQINAFIFWTMGGLEGRTWPDIIRAIVVIAPVGSVAFFFKKRLNLLMLGEHSAHSAGLNVGTSKILMLVIASVLTSMAISIAGPIGFIGLMVPHMARLMVGHNFKRILPLAAILGPIVLLIADILGRVIAMPYEIRVGIITAALGSPYFIWLVVRAKKKALI